MKVDNQPDSSSSSSGQSQAAAEEKQSWGWPTGSSWLPTILSSLLVPGLVYAALIIREMNVKSRLAFEGAVIQRAAYSAATVNLAMTGLVSNVSVLTGSSKLSPTTAGQFVQQAKSILGSSGIDIVLRSKSLGVIAPADKSEATAVPLDDRSRTAAQAALSTKKPQFSSFVDRKTSQRGIDVWLVAEERGSDPVVLQVRVPAAYFEALFKIRDGEAGWNVTLVDGSGEFIVGGSGRPAIANQAHNIPKSTAVQNPIEASSLAPSPAMFQSSAGIPNSDWRLSISAPLIAADAFSQRNWNAFLLVAVLLTGTTLMASLTLTRQLESNVDELSSNISALARGTGTKPLGRSFPEFRRLMLTVSETKSALERLRPKTEEDATADKLRVALSAAGTGVWQWNRVTGEIRCDECMPKLFEAPAQNGSIPAQAFMARIERSDRTRVAATVRNILKKPHPLIDDVRFERADGERRWISLKGIPELASDGTVQGLIGIANDITDAKRSSARTEALLREVTHRSKNMLALILAMARLTAREATDIDSHLKDFSLRVAGLSASQDLIVAADWQSVDLGALAVAQTEAIARDRAHRIAITGPSFLLTPEASQTLGMILTELTLNALSSGALSTPEGHIKLTWSLTGGGEIELIWRETGGAVFAQQPKGYSMAAVERFSIQGLKISANFTSEDNGFTWTLSGPVENLGIRPQAHRT